MPPATAEVQLDKPPNFNWAKLDEYLFKLGWSHNSLADRIGRAYQKDTHDIARQLRRIRESWRASQPWHKHICETIVRGVDEWNATAHGQRHPLVAPVSFLMRGTIAEAWGENIRGMAAEAPLPLLNRGEAIQRLESNIRRSRDTSVLYVSIEHALGLLTFLQGMRDLHEIRFGRVVIRCIPQELSGMLMKNRALPEDYEDAQRKNLRQCDQILKHAAGGITPEIAPWPALPPLHGFLYDDCLLWGHWRVSEEGYLTVNHTRMWEASRGGPFGPIFDRLAGLMTAGVPEPRASVTTKRLTKPRGRARRKK